MDDEAEAVEGVDEPDPLELADDFSVEPEAPADEPPSGEPGEEPEEDEPDVLSEVDEELRESVR